ncbi:MAG: glutathione S-transferase [Microvirga sp.]
MSDDPLRIEDAATETCPPAARPIAADARVVLRVQVAAARGRFAAAIEHFEKAIAARDVPILAQGIA